ncbi:class I SAM-dependent methyltransferase [Mangrovicoccus ximenensis]|uniref:class I SAM-dependent methyltransferase n=1 Tax=Mangrovicoccus ximenensis TaxID=1911570 RepID=UPI000D354015|nr:class I SAM-dependent methyltransferase [Mangrovicoccus ximenensis]
MAAPWGGGYPVATRYLETAQPLQAPELIDLALLAAGFLPPRRGCFRYAELGCGTGFTLIGLAALHPEGQFLGVDFMPEHVARARAFIAEAGLGNIEIVEASFAELAAAAPPEAFDYVAMHGVWTWVSEENRGHLAAILGRWLAPGGVCYNGYAAAAGWQETALIRRIFREVPRLPGRPPFEGARAAVDAFLANGGGTETTARLWERFAKLPDSYLAHDLGAVHATACWCAEVAGALASAKTEFAAPADLFDQFDLLRFEPGWAEFVRKAAAEGWGESARDMACARGFRTDLFGRGTPRLGEAEQQARLGALGIPRAPCLAGRRLSAAGCRIRPRPWPDRPGETFPCSSAGDREAAS